VNQRNLSERRDALHHCIKLSRLDVLDQADAGRFYVLDDLPCCHPPRWMRT